MPKLSDELLFEKWAAEFRGGDGDFRVRVYEILIKFGISTGSAWQLTNRVRRYAAAYAHLFDANAVEVEIDKNGKKVYPIWHFIRGLTYKFLLQELREKKAPQRSQLIARALAEVRDPHQGIIIEYPLSEELEDLLAIFNAELPESFVQETFFKAEVDEINRAIANQQQAIEHLERKGRKKPDTPEVTAYVNAVEALKRHILKTLTPEEPAS